MGKVLRKLQSNNGATLMLALLFFIVCAVTGSMILTSASAASGRLKGMNKQDQNYYAVSSAVTFLEKTLCSEDKYIRARDSLETIVEKETITHADGEEEEIEVTRYIYEEPKLYNMEGDTEKLELTSGILFELLTDDGIDSEDDRITYFKEKSSANGSGDTARDKEDYPDEFNLKWFKGGETSDFTGAFPTGESAADVIKKTVLTVKSEDGENLPLSVDISMYLDKTGILLIKCENHVEESGEGEEDNDSDDVGNTYSMIIKMECVKKIEMKETGTKDDRTKTRYYSFRFNTLSIEKA